MNEISFDVTKEENELISAIADRAVELYEKQGISLQKLEVVMDITATHANGCPLKLEDLLVAEDFDFIHDIAGIRQHLSRATGKLDNLFLPRFAQGGAR